MMRRRFHALSISAVIALIGARAEATGGWASSAALQPIEQRVAISAGPQRVTLWTSLRFSTPGGPLVILVPAPPGAALDIASDAWFESLEVATAPRIFPPAGMSPFCPGKSGSPNIFELDGHTGHAASLAPLEVAVLDDASKAASWASAAGITISPALQASLAKLSGVRFLGVSFNAPAGEALTPTLRVAMSSMPPALPLTLTRAGTEDLRVTAWTIGPGRGDFIGGVEVAVSPSSVVWNAKDGESDYVARREAALGSDPSRFLVEAASHQLFGESLSIASGSATIDSIASTFFERAAAYGDGNFDAAACLSLAETALESSSPVAEVCPQASIGVVPPSTNCTESPGPGKTNPGFLRCGPGADDLAIALSGAVPKDTFITRHALVIPAGGDGLDWIVGFPSKAPLSPVINAASVSYDTCNTEGGKPDGGSMSSSSSSSSASSGAVSSGGPYIHDYGEDPGGVYVEIELDDVIDPIYDEGCSCDSGYNGYASYDSEIDDCSSDTSASVDSCSSDTTGDASCSGSSDGIDTEGCSGDAGGEACDSSGAGEACSSGGGEACSGGGSSGCSGGSSFDCTTSRARRVRGPKFSILLLSALAVLAPLRRRGTKAREAERAAKRASKAPKQ